MKEIEISDIAKETVSILNYFNPTFISKISDNVLKGLNELAEKSSKSVKIDTNKKLKEQDIADETKELIVLIYYNYIATEEQKKVMMRIWNKNELLYREEIKIKYNLDNIFKRERNIKEEKRIAIVEGKESIFQKILKMMKCFRK